MTDELAQIAAELYAGAPGDFVAARNARAKDAADPDLAKRIRALRKPSVAAWVVNVFATERAAQLGEALQLADELREAQADLDAPALAQLSRQRRALTNRLADDAVALASARGGRVTPATVEAVRQTITAAFFDPDAATAVASGRLIRELEPSGAFPIDLDEAVGGGSASASRPAPPPVDELKERRERRNAERAVHEAEQNLARAQREHGRADRDARAAQRRIDELAAQVTEREVELSHVREQLDTARAARPAQDERTDTAAAAVEDAEQALEAARAELERLT